MVERIIAAALRLVNGTVCALQPPARHGEVNWLVADQYDVPTALATDQGFLTSDYRFVDRYEGWLIADAAGQILPDRDDRNTRRKPRQLYSEHLWKGSFAS